MSRGRDPIQAYLMMSIDRPDPPGDHIKERIYFLPTTTTTTTTTQTNPSSSLTLHRPLATLMTTSTGIVNEEVIIPQPKSINTRLSSGTIRPQPDNRIPPTDSTNRQVQQQQPKYPHQYWKEYQNKKSTRTTTSPPSIIYARIMPDNSKSISFEQFDDEEIPSSNRNRSKFDTKKLEPIYVVNHNFDRRNNQRSRSLSQTSRILFVGLSLVAGAATAYSSYNYIMKIPSLNSQIQELEEQVNRLEVEVNRLEQENQRFNNSNNILNSSIFEFQTQNQYLNGTRIRLNQSMTELSNEISTLQGINADLVSLTNDLHQQVNELNATIVPIEQQVNELNGTVMEMIEVGTTLEELKNKLSGNITELQSQNSILNATNDSLNTLLSTLQTEQIQLSTELENLQNVTVFLGGSSTIVLEQLRQVAQNLSEQILLNRKMGMLGLRVQAYDSKYNWDCSLSDVFPGLVSNPNTPIGPNAIVGVMDEVTTAFVAPLCLNRTDLEHYLDEQYDLTNQMTVNELLMGTDVYSDAALTYYYPKSGQQGLTMDQWESANYQCQNISKFSYFSS